MKAKKGISPVVSYVLIVAIVVIISIGSYIWADYTQRQFKDKLVVKDMESQMVGLDTLVREVAHGDTNYTLTHTIYYQSGTMDVVAGNDWIRYITQTKSEIYKSISQTPDANDSCTSDSVTILDSQTQIKMNKIPFTNVYRGSSGNELGQRVEMVDCFPNIDIVVGEGCIGKSGPSSRITIKKIGYSGSKPVVQVGIC